MSLISDDTNGTRFYHTLTSQIYRTLTASVRKLCPDANVAEGYCFGIGGDSYVGVKDANGHWHVFNVDGPEAPMPTCQILTESELQRLVMKLATRLT